jgi:hypothetical protein
VGYCGNARLSEEALECWQSSRCDFPGLGRQWQEREQQERENLLDGCLGRIEGELRRVPRSSAEAEEAVARLTTSAAALATCALGIEDSYVDSLLREGFSAMGVELARRARELDARVSMADVLQACRNAWTAGALQLLFGREMRLTPALFAYSMLYPYSDNYLDDARVTPEAKLLFSERFRDRLAGENVAAGNSREEIIWRLVGLIESQYPRPAYPGVYESLLQIHRAQQDSIIQARGGDVPVLKLSVTKGGASVLADAFLAAGSLFEEEASFAFQWGVLLQFSDDLQDFREDSKNGSLTLFTKAARDGEPLDALTSRTFHFGANVLAKVDGLACGGNILRELLTRSSRSLLIRSAACAAEFYTPSYVRKLEAYSPFRFEFLRSRERRFARRQKSVRRLFELFAGGESGGNDKTLTRTACFSAYS